MLLNYLQYFYRGKVTEVGWGLGLGNKWQNEEGVGKVGRGKGGKDLGWNLTHSFSPLFNCAIFSVSQPLSPCIVLYLVFTLFCYLFFILLSLIVFALFFWLFVNVEKETL